MPGLDETENEFRWRIKSPDLYSQFRRKEIDSGVSIVLGKNKNTGKWETQALRFDKAKFDKEKARKWIKDHEGNFSEDDETVLTYELPETFNISDVEIFSVGKWNGDMYTEKDVEDLVRNFEETKPALRPYLKLGHDDNQILAQRDGMPAVGWIEKLRKVGSKIYADFCDVPRKIYDLIKAGAYKRISSEIFFNIKIENKTYNKALKAVSLLGADTPAVQNLNDIIALYDMGAEVVNFDEKIQSKTYNVFEDSNKGDNMELEELKKLYEEEKAKNEELKKEGEEKDKKLEEKEKEIAEKDKAVEEANKGKTEAEAKVAANELVAKRKDIEIEVDKLIADPKTFAMPVDKDVLCKLIEHLEVGSEIKKYKIGEEEKTTTEMFREMLSRERIAMNTDNKSETGEFGSDKDNEALAKKAIKYSKDNNVSYKDALIAVSK